MPSSVILALGTKMTGTLLKTLMACCVSRLGSPGPMPTP